MSIVRWCVQWFIYCTVLMDPYNMGPHYIIQMLYAPVQAHTSNIIHYTTIVWIPMLQWEHSQEVPPALTRGYDQNEDIKRMMYAKPWHMPCIRHGRLVRQKDGHSEGSWQSRPIQAVPENLVRCHWGISVWDHNRHILNSRPFFWDVWSTPNEGDSFGHDLSVVYLGWPVSNHWLSIIYLECIMLRFWVRKPCFGIDIKWWMKGWDLVFGLQRRIVDIYPVYPLTKFGVAWWKAHS